MNRAVPNLAIAHGRALVLENPFLAQQSRIESWLRRQFSETPPPVYASVDLRNAGFKLAPVDTNLFPAGFNNLNPAFDPLCIQAIQAAVERSCPTAARLLLVPENHTRNRYYLESVARLQALIAAAGFDVRVASLSPEVTGTTRVELDSGAQLTLEPLRRSGDRLHLDDGFSPCSVILNNDLSGGVPEMLRDVAQPVLPPVSLGWSSRLKSQHFGFYREVAREFAEHVGLDAWLLDPLFRNCGDINFMKNEGEDCLVSNVERLLADIRAKYRAHDIDDEPFVIIKADAGTYGMGVMTARSVDDVRNLNRNMRKKMASAKEGMAVTGAIVQEGVPTYEGIGEPPATAEPVVYMIDRFVVGGFYRVHESRGRDENLNAPGARFHPLAFAESCNVPTVDGPAGEAVNRFYAYGVVARLALLAAARELAASQEVRA